MERQQYDFQTTVHPTCLLFCVLFIFDTFFFSGPFLTFSSSNLYSLQITHGSQSVPVHFVASSIHCIFLYIIQRRIRQKKMSTQSVKEVIEATIENSISTPPVSTVPSEQRGTDIDGLGKDGVNLNTAPDKINAVSAESNSTQTHDATSQPSTVHYGNPAYYPFQNNLSQPPSSPAGGAANLASAGYIQDLFMKQQQGVGNVLNTRQQYPNNLPGPPLSPLPTVNVIQATGEEGPNLSMGTIAPASPLFPGAVGFGSNPADQQEHSRLNGVVASPTSPSLYPLSPLYSGMYHGGPASIPNSPETRSWSDR